MAIRSLFDKFALTYIGMLLHPMWFCVGRGALTPPRIPHHLPFHAVGTVIDRPPPAPQRPWLPFRGAVAAGD